MGPASSMREESGSEYTPYTPSDVPKLETSRMPPSVYASEPYYQPISAQSDYPESATSIPRYPETSTGQYAQSYDEPPTSANLDTSRTIGIRPLSIGPDRFADTSSRQNMLPLTPIHEISTQTQETYEYAHEPTEQDITCNHVHEIPNGGPEDLDSIPIIATTVPDNTEYDRSFYWPQLDPAYDYSPMNSLPPYNQMSLMADAYMMYKQSENEPLLPSERVGQLELG
ncbi:MAG: hypothetical protein M1814_001463 [Vezdaea aestivalis]|nr:MAG: hypothetical protein M1814_001463 [Vezdaea aestivalis]